MEKIKLEINGREVEAAPGQTILEVVREQELDDIPTLCHSPELKPYGSCFVCVVEVEGRGNLVPSCATRVAPGMKVTTRNERIEFEAPIPADPSARCSAGFGPPARQVHSRHRRTSPGKTTRATTIVQNLPCTWREHVTARH